LVKISGTQLRVDKQDSLAFVVVELIDVKILFVKSGTKV
jgi:hypothetical protein